MIPNPKEPKPRGRPRKTPVPQNPDERVATRGYVKCIARRIDANSGHNHEVKESKFISELGDVFCLLALVFTMGDIVEILLGRMGDGIFPSVVIASIMSWCVVYACVSDFKQNTEPSEIFSAYPPEIERWEPPEPKKEC